jgi:hypothetical protein
MATKRTISELDLARVANYCEAKIPPHVRDKIRIEYSVRGRSVTIVECRPPWREGLGTEWTRHRVAQMRLDPSEDSWTLFWRDRNDNWHLYDLIEPGTMAEMLDGIAQDRTGIFWG